jgi:hypothetical protein
MTESVPVMHLARGIIEYISLDSREITSSRVGNLLEQ